MKKKKNKLTAECTGILSDIKNLVTENAKKPLDQDEYAEKYQSFVQKYEKAEVSLQKIEDEQESRKFKITYIENFMETLNQNDKTITEFNEDLWQGLVEKVTIYKDRSVVFEFKNGMIKCAQI